MSRGGSSTSATHSIRAICSTQLSPATHGIPRAMHCPTSRDLFQFHVSVDSSLSHSSHSLPTRNKDAAWTTFSCAVHVDQRPGAKQSSGCDREGGDCESSLRRAEVETFVQVARRSGRRAPDRAACFLSLSYFFPPPLPADDSTQRRLNPFLFSLYDERKRCRSFLSFPRAIINGGPVIDRDSFFFDHLSFFLRCKYVGLCTNILSFAFFSRGNSPRLKYVALE